MDEAMGRLVSNGAAHNKRFLDCFANVIYRPSKYLKKREIARDNHILREIVRIRFFFKFFDT